MAILMVVGVRRGGAAQSTSRAAKAAASIPADTGQERALLRLVGVGGKIHRMAHFIIASNADSNLVDSLSSRLERTFASIDRFCVKSGFAVKPLDRRLEVLFFNTCADYRKYGRRVGFNSEGTYGFFYLGTNISTFFNVENDPNLVKLQKDIEAARKNVSRMDSALKSIRAKQAVVEIVYPDGRIKPMTKYQARDELEANRRDLKALDNKRMNYCDRINQTVLQHEVAHQVLYNTGVHVRGGDNPRWLVEGLACIFETPPSADGSGVGTINQARLKDFRTAVGVTGKAVSVYAGMYSSAVAKGEIASIKNLIAQPELFDQRGESGASNYAAAWALVHYLHRAHNKALPGYLQAVALRKPGQALSAGEELELFQQHFGIVDDAFVRRFSSFILSLPCKSSGGL